MFLNILQKQLKQATNKHTDKTTSQEKQTEAENYAILFGGMIFRLVSVNPIYEDSILTHYQFRLIPTSVGLKDKLGIRYPDDYDLSDDTIVKKFPAAYCILESKDPMNMRWRIDCTWDAKAMDVDNAIINDLRRKLNLSNATMKSDKRNIAAMKRTIKKLSENPDVFFENAMKKAERMKKLYEEDEKGKQGLREPLDIGEYE